RPLYELRKIKGTSKFMIASAANRFEVPRRTRGKYRRDLKSAVLALLQEIANLGEQFFLAAWLRRRRGSFLLVLQLVHETNDNEQHEGDDDEVQRQRQE